MNAKKKQIIDAAHRLFIEKGFALTSIQDILDEAGIAKGTFYNYFASKNECLMAILEFVKEEGDQKRKELAHGKLKDNEKVLVAQIAIRMNINRKHSIMAVFESVSVSDDTDLKTLLKNQHIEELKWLSTRITEVFRFENRRYSLDHAVMLLGMVHHLMHVWKLGTSKEIASEEVIQFALNRLKPIIEEQMQSKEVFFQNDWLPMSIDPSVTDSTEMKKKVLVKLERLDKKVGKMERIDQKKSDYIKFLQDELQAEWPRTFLLESVLMSLSHVFEQSDYEHEVNQLSKMVWQLMEQIEA
ncbi:TetR/AcrR family transcriptional regulator [Virgibacillus oceani]|uniref:TetR family transcriptional regulator n=1 Tax=Virgibacillus oceani TaxID=1479511 RepID=A0A917HMD2_9BACI|nr:TetR/AcrR family transcriptional regulator [Virgibacillus oceani]GGG83470.1 TetR family transcriptional regulator [Virgibacillus oceani]